MIRRSNQSLLQHLSCSLSKATSQVIKCVFCITILHSMLFLRITKYCLYYQEIMRKDDNIMNSIHVNWQKEMPFTARCTEVPSIIMLPSVSADCIWFFAYSFFMTGKMKWGKKSEVVSQKLYAWVVPKKQENISVKSADLQLFSHTRLTTLTMKIAIPWYQSNCNKY